MDWLKVDVDSRHMLMLYQQMLASCSRKNTAVINVFNLVWVAKVTE